MSFWALYLLFTSFIIPGSLAGNTTCATNLLDWYTSAVGETPCRTYERLRQICNQDYQVPTFRPLTPGDNCDDQFPECCCNSVAWSLSMLCMNCQHCLDRNGGCIDAGVGAYQIYQNNAEGGTCSSRTALLNKTLSRDVQAAACNKDVRIPQALYDIFWGDGAWFYVFTRDATTKALIAKEDGAFHECPTRSSSVNPIMSPTLTVSTSSIPDSSPRSTNVGAIAGGVVGGVVSLILLIVLLLWRRNRSVQRRNTLDLSQDTAPKPFIASAMVEVPQPQPPVLNIAPVVPPLLPHPKYRESTQHKPHGSDTFRVESLYDAPSSSRNGDSSTLNPTSPASDEPERHIDAGPYLTRSPSGRLPPSYGVWDS